MNTLSTKYKAVLGIVFMMSSLFFSCKDNPSSQELEEPYQLESNLFMAENAFERALSNTHARDGFDILEIRREGTYLHVEVQGGSDAQAFRFLWDGWIQESYPMGIRLVLQHEQERTDYDPDRIIYLKVNLSKIIGKRNMEDYHFYLINGSKVQTATLNPDGTVSGP